jgi:glycosyltransferase involved in cell wall biosynthesis
MKLSISVVIPVYNSEESLPLLIERLEKVLSKLSESFELILVNDGSKDESWPVISHYAKSRHWIRGIDLMRNYGQHNALLCGIREARNEIIITMDDDLQHPPEEIPKLLNKLAEGNDVVYGTPQEEQHGLWRDIASKITKLAFHSVLGTAIAPSVSAFRTFHSQVRNAFASYKNPFVSIDVLLTWGTTRFASVSVRHEPRPMGHTNYTFRKLVTHAINMMTGFSTLPLQMASLGGFAFMLFGLGVLVYVILRYLIQGGSVPGFPFLASIVAIFSGAQLFALGIIGEYLGRMHSRMSERPIYTVRETVTDVENEVQ